MKSAQQFLGAICLALIAGNAQAESPQQTVLRLAQAARTQHQLPAVAILVQRNGHVIAQLALGVRKVGDDAAVTTTDLWHIGSCTKAMTATMIARLVERGVFKFNATMDELFPEISSDMDVSLRKATLAQMLSHTAGLGDAQSLESLRAMIGDAHDVVDQRRALTRYVLARAPEAMPGTRFKYSNLGYVIAAAAAEERTHKSWEELIRENVFIPLRMKTAGFGAPGVRGRVDQPYGHIAGDGKITPVEPDDTDAVIPPVLAPAGGVHVSLVDWARFVQDQVNGALGHGKLLTAESYRELQTPVAPSAVYGMGWGVKRAPDGSLLVLTHNGSTDPWFAEIRAYPMSNLITLVATNRGDDDGGGASVKEIGHSLADALEPRR